MNWVIKAPRTRLYLKEYHPTGYLFTEGVLDAILFSSHLSASIIADELQAKAIPTFRRVNHDRQRTY